jgi:hypothetical protein
MDVTLLVVGLAAAAGTVGAAAVGPILNRRWLKQNVGEANGHGNLSDMGTTLILWSETHQNQDDERHEEVVRRLDSLEGGTKGT